MKKKPKLSACLIVKNEEKLLQDCLQSLQGLVDEIVVVDTGSTDRSLAIAEKHAAIIGNFDWRDDFSAARNHALSLATGEWILWIDADEVVCPESIAAVKAALLSDTYAGFNAKIVNFTADESDLQTYEHKAVRLFKKLSNSMFTGKIHEQVTPALENARLQWADLPGFQIDHQGYRPAIMSERAKIERTIRVLTAELEADPSDSFQWFNLANAYVVGGRWAEAEKAALECIATMDGKPDYAVLNFQFLITALRSQCRFSDALAACIDAEQAGCWNFLLDFEKATTLYQIGRFAEALNIAEACVAAEWPANGTGDKSIFEFKRWIILGQILTALGKFDEASLALANAGGHPMALFAAAANAEKSGDPKLAYDLYTAVQPSGELAKQASDGAGRAAMKLGLPKVACACFEKAWRLDPNDQTVWTRWVAAAETYGDLNSIVAAYDAYSAQQTPSAAILVNWGRALEAAGDEAKALTCYTEAIARDPNDPNAHFNAGDLLYKGGQYQDAAQMYQLALKLTPLNAQGWFVLGNSLARLGIVEGAKIGYRQALTIDPMHEEAKHNLELVSEAA